MKDSSVSYADCVQFIQGQFCNSNEHKHGINSFMQQPSHFFPRLPPGNRHIVLLICGGIKHHSVRRTSPHFFPARLLHIESWIFISKVRWESSICKKWTADFVRVFPLPGSKFQPWLEPRINFDKVILLPLPLTNEYLSTLPRSMPDVISKWIRYKIKKIVINK